MKKIIGLSVVGVVLAAAGWVVWVAAVTDMGTDPGNTDMAFRSGRRWE